MKQALEQPLMQSGKPLASWMCWGLALCLVWVVLTEANLSAWAIGIFVVPLATWVALSLFPNFRGKDQNSSISPKIVISEVPSFSIYFLYQSLLGGWECAKYALDPRKKVKPRFIQYKTQLPEGSPRLMFINIVSLIPGTMSTAISGDSLKVHVLDSTTEQEQGLSLCELRIAKIYGLNLSSNEASK